MIIGLKKDKLLWMAGEITLARRRIREAVHLMQHDEDREFFASCYRFEKSQFKNFERFYLFESPEFIDSIRHGDHDAIAEALLFLEADPYCFRSGYMKKKLCHALKQAPLEKEERFRIRALILKAVCVQRPVSFADFASLASSVYTPGFHLRAVNLKIIPFKYIFLRKKLLLQKLEKEYALRKNQKKSPEKTTADASISSLSSHFEKPRPLLHRLAAFLFSFEGENILERLKKNE